MQVCPMASAQSTFEMSERRNSKELPPDMRILLLGNNCSQRNVVGNLILGRKALDDNYVYTQCERTRGRTAERGITVINTPNLFDTNISQDQLSKHLLSCIALSEPGPHVIMLVVQPEEYTEKDTERMKYIMEYLNDDSYRFSMVVKTDQRDTAVGTCIDPHKKTTIDELIQQCHQRCFMFKDSSDQSQVLLIIERIIKDNKRAFLSCDIYEDTIGGVSQDNDNEDELKHDQKPKEVTNTDVDLWGSIKTMGLKAIRDISKTDTIRESTEGLRIVLLGGSDDKKTTAGNIILGGNKFTFQFGSAKVCVSASGHLNGIHTTIVKTPDLFRQTEDVLVQGIDRCISMCSPGPHVLLLVLKPQDFTEKNKKKLMFILNEFGQKAFSHSMVLIPKKEEVFNSHLDEVINLCDGRHHIMHSDSSNNMILKQNIIELVNKNKWQSLNKRTLKNTFKHLPRLNIILCGSGENTEIANSLLIECDSVQEPYPGFMKKEGDMSEHRVTLIQIPALFKTHLAQEEVMRETLHCLSLCDPPGVHAFLLVMPVHPLTDEDKGELKTLQGIFGARFDENLRVVFRRDYMKVEQTTVEFLEKNAEGLLNACNRKYDFFDVQKEGNGTEILAKIIKAIEKGHNCYKLYDFVKAKETALKEDLDVKHNLQLTKMKKENEETIKTLIRGAESQPSSSESLRIVLIGKTGNGKSASGNTILGQPEFESDTSPDSVTTICQKAIGEVDGREVAVVDTPGLFDTTLSNTEIQQEIVKCISLSSPGPHAFLIVLSIGRITQEELDSLKLIKATFGLQATQYAIVLFTRGDDLKQKSIQDYVGNAKNANLKKLINDCGGRYHAFNNNENLDRTQVSELFEKICAMTSKNEDSYYTNEMFKEAERAIQQKQDEIIKEKEEEIKAETEKLKLKHETEMKEISLKLERLEFQKERERGEKELKKKEEMIKRNYEEKENKANMKRQSEDLQRKKAEKKQREQWEAERKTMEREILIQKAELERSNMVKEKEYREIIEKQIHEDTVKEEKLKCQVQELIELKRKQEKENNRRDEDETKRKKKEKEEKEMWEKRIKEAERDQSEMQLEMRKNAMEWEERLMKERKIREEDEQLRRKREAENLAEQTGKHSQMKEEFERELNQNRLIARRAEDQRDRERKERDRIEKELEERMKEHTAKTKKQQEEWEKDREKEREFRQQEDEKRREAEKTKIKKLEDDFNRELEEAEQKRKKENIARTEKEERRIIEMEEQFERKTKELMSIYENEARKRAEEFNDFKDKYEKDFKQLLKKHDEEQEKLTKRYKAEYDTLSSLYSNDKEQLISKIKEIEKEHKVEKKRLEEAKKTAEELFLRVSEKKGFCVLL